MRCCMRTCRQGQDECSECVKELRAPFGVTQQQSYTSGSTCLPAARGKESPLEVCKALLEEFRVAPAMYQVGRTKLFFRAGVLGHLEDTWARIQRSAATKLTICPMTAGACCSLGCQAHALHCSTQVYNLPSTVAACSVQSCQSQAVRCCSTCLCTTCLCSCLRSRCLQAPLHALSDRYPAVPC